MKKILSIMLVLVMLLTVLPLGAIPVSAATSGQLGNCTWVLEGDHLIFSGRGAMGNLSLVDSDRTAPWGDGVVRVTIEEGVTSIGDDVFYGCDTLESVSIPHTVTSIGRYAFGYCRNLPSVTIPDSVTSIGACAFESCQKFTSVTIPASVTCIEASAFRFCSNLTSFVVDNENLYYTAVDGVLFKEKTLVCYPTGKSGAYAIPNGVTAIGESAFDSCSNLTSIDIPGSVTAIGESAFEWCYNLTSVTIPGSVTGISSGAFFGCYNLTTVTLADGVTSIGHSAFRWCDMLTSIALPASLASIDYNAFFSCDCLADVWYGGSNRESISFIDGGNDCLLQATWYYNCCSGEHSYTNACATQCNKCGYVRSSVATHTYAAACATTCSVCGAIRAASAEHTYTSAVTRQPTCGNDGVRTYTCSDCGEFYTDSIPATNKHTDSSIITKQPTCGDDGVRTYTCSDCSRQYTEVIPATNNHTYTTDCDTDCNLCGATRMAAPHVYDHIKDDTCNDCSFVRDLSTIPAETCDACKGYGKELNGCSNCFDGTYYPECPTCEGMGYIYTLTICADCEVVNGSCQCCEGSGWTRNCDTCWECEGCNGKGYYDDFSYPACTDCRGSGVSSELANCAECEGKGFVVTDALCAKCNGAGSYQRYLVLYDANGGVGGPLWQEMAGCQGTLSLQTPTRLGYLFMGWKSTATGAIYQPGDAYSAGEDTMSAVWYEPCLRCDGTGEAALSRDCYSCNGSGRAGHCNNCGSSNVYTTTTGSGSYSYCRSCGSANVTTRCGSCGGDGKVSVEGTCPDCRGVGGHLFDNVCDATCNDCGFVRTVPDHVYDGICDDYCNICGFTRQDGHMYYDSCDASCNLCGHVRTNNHSYSNACDTTCNLCGATRKVGAHVYTDEGDTYCDICSYRRAAPYSYFVTDEQVTITKYNGKATTITIPDTLGGYPVTAIGEEAFMGCETLVSVTIPGSITTIGYCAFGYSYSLTTVRLSEGLTTIGELAFGYCTELTGLILPDSVTTIGDAAFEMCIKLKEITLGKGVVTIGNFAFGWCSELTAIHVPDDHPLYASVDGVLFNKPKTNLILCPGGKSGTYTVPDGVTSIGDRAFDRCRKLTMVVISDSVTTVGRYAFYGCSEITRVVLGSGVRTVADFAFWCRYDDCNSTLAFTLYRGTRAQRDAISFGEKNDDLLKAAWKYEVDPSGVVDITTQPVSVQVKNGTTAKVIVEAAGEGLTYTWYIKNSGAKKYSKSSIKTNTYSVKMSSTSRNRYIYCVIKDKYGTTVKTNTVVLRMAATITKQPTTAFAKRNATAKVTLTAAGDGLTYQWYVKNPGATEYVVSSVKSATYSAKMTEQNSGRLVYCVVTDKYGHTAQTKTVVMRMQASIVTQPKSATVKNGTTAKTTVKAAGDGLTYTWYIKNKGAKSFTKSSVKTNTYTVKMSTKVNGRQVYCVVKDKYGKTVKSSTVTLKKK